MLIDSTDLKVGRNSSCAIFTFWLRFTLPISLGNNGGYRSLVYCIIDYVFVLTGICYFEIILVLFCFGGNA